MIFNDSWKNKGVAEGPEVKTCRATVKYSGGSTNLAARSESCCGLSVGERDRLPPLQLQLTHTPVTQKVSQMFLHASPANSSACAPSITEASAFRHSAARLYSSTKAWWRVDLVTTSRGKIHAFLLSCFFFLKMNGKDDVTHVESFTF